jgi:hypothetical protein
MQIYESEYQQSGPFFWVFLSYGNANSTELDSTMPIQFCSTEAPAVKGEDNSGKRDK